jgi:hypothetical protein
VTIFDALVAELGDPFRAELAAPAVWHDWTDIIPPPSLNEVLERIAGGDWNQITRAQQMLDAERVLRRISARSDTQSMPKVEVER